MTDSAEVLRNKREGKRIELDPVVGNVLSEVLIEYRYILRRLCKLSGGVMCQSLLFMACLGSMGILVKRANTNLDDDRFQLKVPLFRTDSFSVGLDLVQLCLGSGDYGFSESSATYGMETDGHVLALEHDRIFHAVAIAVAGEYGA